MSATVHGPGDISDISQVDEPDCKLYLISPPQIELRTFYAHLEEAVDAGDIGCFQLRLKDVSDDIILGMAETLMPLLKDRGIPFLINDRPNLAVQAGADGVHIGQNDASYEEARSIIGSDGIVGVTCHDSRHLAVIAAEKGADYVAFGAFFPTTTKDAPTSASPDLVRWWCDTTIVQCVAIGGITVENCAPVVAAGADFLAISAGIWNYKDGPGAAVRAFQSKILHTPRQNPVI
jgi:thiamine-phosphate pyrophosphorylase